MVDSLHNSTIFSRSFEVQGLDMPKRLFNSPFAIVGLYTPLDWDSGNAAFTIYDLH